MAEAERNFPRLGPLETIINVGWPGGIAILEYATEVVAGSSTAPPGRAGLEILDTVLRTTDSPSWLPSGLFIFQGAGDRFTTGPNLRVPAGAVPPIVDPISPEMRKLLVWSAPPTSDMVTSSRFGTGRTLLFFNCSKIFGAINKGKAAKDQKKEFTFTLNTMDPHIVPGAITAYYLWDSNQGTLEDALAHPVLIYDPLTGKPDSDIKGYIYIPALYTTQEEADLHAASITHWIGGPLTSPFDFDDSVSNTVRWRARLTTYKKQPKKTDPNAPTPPKPTKQFPVGSGEIDTLLDESLTPAPGWDVNADTNVIPDAELKDVDVFDKQGDASDKERSNDTTTRPETACTLTFKVTKKTTEGPNPKTTLEPSIVRTPDRRP